MWFSPVGGFIGREARFGGRAGGIGMSGHRRGLGLTGVGCLGIWTVRRYSTHGEVLIAFA
jgi:hypothetical protein